MTINSHEFSPVVAKKIVVVVSCRARFERWRSCFVRHVSLKALACVTEFSSTAGSSYSGLLIKSVQCVSTKQIGGRREVRCFTSH